jgi:hypothetical protein
VLPSGVFRSRRRSKLADQNAFSRLNDLVRRAAIELSTLGLDPVAVAASPNRFDDAWTDGDPVFAIWDDEPMSYFGEAEERFDWAIQNERPLVFLSTSKWAHSRNKVRRPKPLSR